MVALCKAVDRKAERKHAEALLAECEGAKVASVRAARRHARSNLYLVQIRVFVSYALKDFIDQALWSAR